ncbi:MAG: AI-2E family transporter [Anaerolineales bacterium]|nr:AI-2E family transporter [Anaerolineales bacterium]
MIDSKPWSRTTRYLVFGLILAAMIWFGYTMRALLPALMVAAFLAYILNPVVAYVNRLSRLPRTWVVTLVYTSIVGILAILVVLSTPILVEQTQLVGADLQNIEDQLIAVINEEAAALGLTIDAASLLGNLSSNFSTSFSSDQIFQAFTVVQATSTNAILLLIVLVTSFYLLKDWHRLREWLIELAPAGYRADTRRLYGEIKDIWQAYLWGQLVLMVTIGVASGLGAALVGLPGSAVALGVIAGVLDLIPSAGPFVAMVIAAVVAWFQGPPDYLPISPILFVILVVGVFGLIQTVENIWLRPRVMGQSLRIHPAIVFVAVMGSLAISGILTALVVVPVISTLGTVGRYLWHKIFELDPWRSPSPSSTSNGKGEDTTAVVTPTTPDELPQPVRHSEQIPENA